MEIRPSSANEGFSYFLANLRNHLAISGSFLQATILDLFKNCTLVSLLG